MDGLQWESASSVLAAHYGSYDPQLLIETPRCSLLLTNMLAVTGHGVLDKWCQMMHQGH